MEKLDDQSFIHMLIFDYEGLIKILTSELITWLNDNPTSKFIHEKMEKNENEH